MAPEPNSSNSTNFFSQTPQLQNSMELPTPCSCSANEVEFWSTSFAAPKHLNMNLLVEFVGNYPPMPLKWEETFRSFLSTRPPHPVATHLLLLSPNLCCSPRISSSFLLLAVGCRPTRPVPELPAGSRRLPLQFPPSLSLQRSVTGRRRRQLARPSELPLSRLPAWHHHRAWPSHDIGLRPLTLQLRRTAATPRARLRMAVLVGPRGRTTSLPALASPLSDAAHRRLALPSSALDLRAAARPFLSSDVGVRSPRALHIGARPPSIASSSHAQPTPRRTPTIGC
jgi:hypothetical protein